MVGGWGRQGAEEAWEGGGEVGSGGNTNWVEMKFGVEIHKTKKRGNNK